MRKHLQWFAVVVLCTVVAGQALAVCPSGPGIVNPTGPTFVIEGTVTLKWTAVSGAASYDVYFGPTGCSAGPVATVNATDFEPDPNNVVPGASYQWKVVANGVPGCVTPPTSSCQAFTTRPCPTASPALIAPAANATPNPGTVTLQWASVNNASAYEVFVGLFGATPSSHGIVTGTSKSFNINPNTEVEWYVSALGSDCTPQPSDNRTFETTSGSCPDGIAALSAPSAGASFSAGTGITFIWTEVPNALNYDLKVNDGEGWEVLTTTTRTRSTETLPAGNYEWEVRTNFAACDSTYSPISTFSITPAADCPTAAPVLLLPAAATSNVANPVKFTWQPVTGAEKYALYVSIDNGPVSLLTTTTGTEHTATLNGTSVLWAVAAMFRENCPEVRSDARRFTLIHECATTVPQPLLPANNATDVTSPVTFKWSAVAEVRRYVLLVAIDGNDFSVVGTTEGTQLEKLVPAGALVRWLVIAERAECPEVRSAVFQFRAASEGCADAAIALVAPANGATVSSPVTLAWTAVANAFAYRVWIATGDTAPVNIVKVATTTTIVNLPSGPMTWYVEALRTNCDPVVSDRGNFTVRAGDCANKPAATLLSPIGSATAPVQVTNPVDLRWSPVDGAIGYRVWLKSTDSAFEDIGLTRETHLLRNLDADSYEWFVQVLYDGCAPVPSAHGFFSIPDTRPRCGTAAPAILAPADGSTATSPVTFLWSGVEAAAKYRVFASVDGGEPIVIGTTGETTITRPLPPGRIAWRVEAVFAECPSTLSPLAQFTIARAQNCSTVQPVLTSPADASTSTAGPVQFVWQPVPGAARYVVFVQIGDGTPTAIAETEATTVERKLPAGRYRWSVLAFFSGCEPTRAADHTFTLTSPASCGDHRAPILFSPSENDRTTASPVRFEWSAVAAAKGYQIWAAQVGQQPSVVATVGPKNFADVALPAGNYVAFIEALFENCPPTESATTVFKVLGTTADCVAPVKPELQVVGQALSGTPYKVRWSRLPQVELYEIQESTTLDFADATTRVADGSSTTILHDVTTTTQFYYRVRGISNCNDERGPFSDVVGVFVLAAQSRNGSAEVGVEGNIVQKLFLPGSETPLQFVATVDKPWLTVTPSAGTLAAAGITLTVTADPSVLTLGTNTGTVTVSYTGAGKGGSVSNATSVTTTPISISLVTPITPSGKGTPPPDALIIPAVARAQGANDSFFESDIRVTNLGAQTSKYQITFTPSGADGTQKGSSSTVEISPNQTLALDDVMATLFGTGSASVIGMLEIRPLTSSTATVSPVSGGKATQVSTIASSRTYNVTPDGTFGQYIPALPYSTFVGKSTTSVPTILSLQQIAQSAVYRTNFGFAEASGQPATLVMRVYDTKNNLLATLPVSLQAGEHKQINAMLAANGITNLEEGRVEIEVTSSTGKVTAYASTVDNLTGDPLMVWPVVKGATSTNRYTLPGMATINTGLANWRSDVRIFNSGASTPATLTFYPQGAANAPVVRELTIDAGEVEAINDILGGLFAQANGAGGSLVITTPANAPIVASARTYNQTSNGTYGQFIPGVTAAQSIGTGERALNILQLEQSSRIRTNVGFAETTGQPATIEVSVILPDTKATPFLSIPLAANEFKQIPLAAFNLGDAVYNARVTVKVISGTGRVTAYGSAIDMFTQDPTYVPAQ